MNTKEQELKNKMVIEWAKQLRATMTMIQIMEYQLEWLMKCPLTPPKFSQQGKLMNSNAKLLKVNIRNFKGLLTECGRQSDAELIADELASDVIHDLNLHMLMIAQFKNVAEITAVIEREIELGIHKPETHE